MQIFSKADILNHMVQYRAERLDRVFRALSDSTRRGILLQLERGPVGVNELARGYDMSLTAVAKHVKVLEEAELAITKKLGRVRSVHAIPEGVSEAAAWIERYTKFWGEALGRFAAFVEGE